MSAWNLRAKLLGIACLVVFSTGGIESTQAQSPEEKDQRLLILEKRGEPIDGGDPPRISVITREAAVAGTLKRNQEEVDSCRP